MKLLYQEMISVIQCLERTKPRRGDMIGVPRMN
jgi:hypothetical protein